MSDRPCNLVEWKRMQRKYEGRDLELRENEYGWSTVYLDGRMVVSYGALPTEAECSAYGGECKC